MQKISRDEDAAQEQESWAPVAADDAPALVPNGEYEIFCRSAQRRFYGLYRRYVVVLSCQIQGEGYRRARVERYFNVPADGKIRRGSDYFREWIIANGGVKPLRRERMSPRKFVGKLFKAQVITVTKDRERRNLDAATSYSKIAALRELLFTDEKVAPQCSNRVVHTPTADSSNDSVY